MTPHRRALLVIAVALVLLAMNLRAGMVVVAPVLEDIRADLHMSAGLAGVLGAASPLAFAVTGLATPAAAQRFGMQRLAWIALLVTAAAQLARLLAGDPMTFLAASAVAYGAMGIGNVLLPPLVKRYFPRHMALMTSAYILALSGSAALPAAVTVPVAEAVGWRGALGAWAVVALLAVVPWLYADLGGPGRTRRAGADPVARAALRPVSLVRAPVAWGLAWLFGLNSFNVYALLTWLPSLLADLGQSPQQSGLSLSLYAVMAFPLGVVVPWLVGRTGRPMLHTALFAGCYLGGYVGLLVAADTATLLWVLLAGLGAGGFPVALTMVGLRSSTAEGAAALSGFTQGVGYAIAGVGPLLVGVLRQVSGGWTVPLVALAASVVLQVFLAALVLFPGSVEHQVGRRRG